MFPPTTLGLTFVILIIESLYLKTKAEVYKKLSVKNRYHDDVMHLLRKFVKLPGGLSNKGGAQMNYVGIDHHRQYSHMTVMDPMGQVLRSGRVPNLQNEIGKFLEGFEAVEAVIETGRSSYTMVDVLEEMGVKVKIAHPNEVKAIARAKIKTDKRDSEVLAHLLRMNMIPEVYRRSPENRRAQRILRQRAFYVRAMTALKKIRNSFSFVVAGSAS